MLYFAFIQWIFAALAPCAVAVLPAYIANLVTNQKDQDTAKKLSRWQRASMWFLVRFFVMVWILVIYGIASLVIWQAADVLKTSMKWIASAMWVVLIILWVMMLFWKQCTLSLHSDRKWWKSLVSQAFAFGLTYAIWALWCLFPLFLVVITQALAAPTRFDTVSVVMMYFVWMASILLFLIMWTMLFRWYVQTMLRRILPKMNLFTAVLVIIAGIYIIWYQYALF